MIQANVHITPKASIKTQLNPKLRYSMQILHMNHQDLMNVIANEIETNPLLEVDGTSLQSSDLYEDALHYLSHEKSLSEILMEQLHFNYDQFPFDIAENIIQLLDTNGYLRFTPAELAKELDYPLEEIQALLTLLKQLEPAGVFAYDLQECLLIQLKSKPHSQLSQQLVLHHLDDLAKQKFDQLAKKLSCSSDDIQAALKQIQSCHPKPASHLASLTSIVSPEVLVEVDEDNEFIFSLFHSYHQLTIHDIKAITKEEKAYVAEKKKQAQLLIQAIEHRNQTLLHVTSEICNYQKDFLLHQAPLLPLTQAQIAKACHLSISTVSRCIAQKGLEFHHQFYAYSSFFSPLLHGQISAHEAKTQLLALISQEDKQHPFTDLELCEKLKEKGIFLTRRGIAKYRKQLHLPNSHYRK